MTTSTIATSGKSRGTPRRPLSLVDHQRAAFLRQRRSRISPEEAGLAAGLRKRTKGLRREEVAALSGVSVCWYTWLEQGRDIRVSDDVLERICQTLQLTDDERTYLFSLVQHRMPRVKEEASPEAPEDVVRMLHSLGVPAIAMNLRWDVLAWNAHSARLYRDYGAMSPGERNLLEILLLRPVHHVNAEQLEGVVQRLCARLRYDYSKYPDDPRFEALVYRLSAQSPLFRRVWRSADFTLRAFGVHRFVHPRHGEMEFEHTSHVPDGHPQIRIVVCTPVNHAAQLAVDGVTTALREVAANSRQQA